MARHAEARDLLGAFALGALNAREAAAVREHLATCADCQAEIAQLWFSVDALPELIEPMEPPPGLRDRISAAILAESATPQTPPAPIPIAQPAPAAAPPAPERRLAEPIRPAAWWSKATPWVAAAAIMLLVSGGLLAWNLRLQQQIAAVPTPETIALVPGETAPDASGQVTYLPDDNLLLLDVRDLPALEPGQVYEVWLLGESGAPVPAGVFDQQTDRHAIVADRSRYTTLAITAEPGPLGTEAPTGEIVATAAL
jgi:anti-sigma-K factor RskA